MDFFPSILLLWMKLLTENGEQFLRFLQISSTESLDAWSIMHKDIYS